MQTQVTANSARLDDHDRRLTDLDGRVSKAQAQADAAYGLAQGKFVTVPIGVKNLSNSTMMLNPSDFKLRAPSGATYSLSIEGSAASAAIGGGAVKHLTQPLQVQPGLTSTAMLVFDVDPKVSSYKLETPAGAFDVTVKQPGAEG